jgi:hypothetical protein
MIFEKEDQIRIINKHGLDSIIQLNYDEQKVSQKGNTYSDSGFNPLTDGVILKSVC